MIKNKIYRYFFLEFFRIFFIVSLSLSILIWMTQATKLLELVTEFGNPIKIYLQYILTIFPKIYAKTLQLSFVITIFFTIIKFENDNELNVYWLSGISKIELVNFMTKITILIFLFQFFLLSFIAPWTLLQGRKILSNAKFSLINGVVKEKNFNSILNGLTIYVEKNDLKGNLNGVFIYETDRTIIAKKGAVIDQNGEFFLELYDGVSQEKSGNNINVVKFKKTTFDFSKFQMKNILNPKFNERNIFWLIENLNNKISKDIIEKKKDIKEEINSRIISPFVIFVLSILGSFLFYNSKNKSKLRIFIFTGSIIILILNQIFLNLSSKGNIETFIYFFSIMIFFISSYKILYLKIDKENKNLS